MYTVERYHDISAGHRVVGHENKCRFLHGHNYRVHFTCTPERTLDTLGRVIDFGVIKQLLCQWLEDNWDHKMLLWENDHTMQSIASSGYGDLIEDSLVWLPFNPTAENMAAHLVNVVGPTQLMGTGVILVCVRIDETRKCSASFLRAENTIIYVVPENEEDWCNEQAAHGLSGELCKRRKGHEDGHNLYGDPA